MTAKRQQEILKKQDRVDRLLEDLQLDGICLSRAINFSWFTAGGNNRVVTGSETGAAAIVYLKNKVYLVAPRNEMNRFIEEQVNGLDFEPVSYEWYESREKTILELVLDNKVGSDIPMNNLRYIGQELNRLRYSLTDEEIEKAIKLAEECSREVLYTCLNLHQGMTEWDIQADLSSRLLKSFIKPAVVLIGTDERAFNYKHAVASSKKLEKYASIGLVGEREGLNIAVTRSIYFGKIPPDLVRLQNTTIDIEKVFLENTSIGSSTHQIFRTGSQSYAEYGYAEEWKLHHQGGAIGYAPREFRAGEGEDETVQVNQMFAWNPTLRGTKCEDTVLVTGNGLRFLTVVPNWWPSKRICIKDNEFIRPLILEL